MDLSTITVADFKAKFYRDFEYATVPSGVEQAIPNPDFVQDQDITNAFQDAQYALNQALFGTDANITLAYLYLTAHFLCQAISSAEGGINGGSAGAFPVASRSVGSVSESYQIPDAYKDSPVLAGYAQTSYGIRYLQMILPKLVGNMTAVYGGTNP